MHTSTTSTSSTVSVDDILAQEIANIKIGDQVESDQAESGDEGAYTGPWWLSPEEEEKWAKLKVEINYDPVSGGWPADSRPGWLDYVNKGSW